MVQAQGADHAQKTLTMCYKKNRSVRPPQKPPPKGEGGGIREKPNRRLFRPKEPQNHPFQIQSHTKVYSTEQRNAPIYLR